MASNLCEALESHGCAYAVPIHEGKADAIRKDMEANLLDCDGLMIVYGQITAAWVREQLRQWQKMCFRREKPLLALAVCEGPPDREHPLGMKLPQMQIIDCRGGVEVRRLQPFLHTLTAEAELKS